VICSFLCTQNITAQTEFPTGKPSVIDGILEPGEWNDAAKAVINVEDDWKITVFFKKDSSNFYFCFTDLQYEDKELYPEVLLDIDSDRSLEWNKDDWWFHASYNDCEGEGKFNVWNCTKSKEGWNANNFPLDSGAVVEFQISFEKVKFDPVQNQTIGLAFNVTDTAELYYFWPSEATLESPETWSVIQIQR
jgi:hypothetical protein